MRSPALVVALAALAAAALVRQGPELATASAQEGASVAAATTADPAAVLDLKAQLEALMEGHTDREEEARIVELFRAAPGPVLDEVLRAIPLGELLGDMDDRVFGPDHRTTLLRLLTAERLQELSLMSRGLLIDALASGVTMEDEEVAIRDVFLGSRGRALTALKNAVDAGDDYHDLEQVIFHDIDEDAVRDAILDHFAAHQAPSGEVKVLSDIDDTLYRNWCDPRFPSKTVYPGIIGLHRELDLGLAASPEGHPCGRRGDLAFITARPVERSGIIESQTHATLRTLGVEHAVVLGGDALHLHSNEAIAAGKVENFRRYRRLFPEYGFVFTGDSGQGDAIAGAAMVAEAPDAVRLVLIHDVVSMKDEARAEWAKKGVVVVDTYVGGACVAFERGLISAAGLARVAKEGREALAAVAFGEDLACKAAREAELERDVARANALLPEALRLR